jgi:hypothetical protein
MPRPRYTLRWMMVAVAIAGIGLGGYRMHRHRLRSLERARSYAESERYCSFMWSEVSAYPNFRWPGDHRPPSSPEELRKAEEVAHSSWERKIDYHANLRRKYERAARYPWLPVAPDPPEPE